MTPTRIAPGFWMTSKFASCWRNGSLAIRTAKDLYDQLPFGREDRARVLELMKACRLVFDHGAGGGLLVPDLLRPPPCRMRMLRVGTWMYMAEFLPEKVFLRFIARHYDAIDHHADRCFRNQVVWRTEGESVLLEAHYSPPGATLPHILIRSATTEAASTRNGGHDRQGFV